MKPDSESAWKPVAYREESAPGTRIRVFPTVARPAVGTQDEV